MLGILSVLVKQWPVTCGLWPVTCKRNLPCVGLYLKLNRQLLRKFLFYFMDSFRLACSTTFGRKTIIFPHSGSKRCRWIHHRLVILRHVWEHNIKRVAHGVPYIEILKGWWRGNILTKLHEREWLYELQTSKSFGFWFFTRAQGERFTKNRTKIETWDLRIVNRTQQS